MGQLVVQPSTTGVDTYISANSTSTNFGTSISFAVGDIFSATDKANRGLIRMDVTSLTSEMVITSAVLTLAITAKTNISSATDFTVHRCTRSTWTNAGATWLTYDGSNAWTTSGGDYVSTAADTTSITNSDTTLVFDGMVALVEDARTNRSGSLEMLIKGPETAGANKFIAIGSSDNTTLSNRPKLTVGYFKAGEGTQQYLSYDGPIQWSPLETNPMSPYAPQIGSKKAAEAIPTTFGFAVRIGNNAAGTLSADPISTATVTASPTGLTIGTPTVNSSTADVQGVEHLAEQAVGVLLSGGTAGVTYTVTCTVVTDGGATHQLIGDLEVT